MSGFVDLIHKFGRTRADDDFFDRLHHHYTVILFIIFTVLVSTKQYVGDPITCWCPVNWSGSMVSYANVVCWISNTYYVPIRKEDPNLPGPNYRKGGKGEIGYYQWVPIILLLQALCFFMPVTLWRAFNKKTGINLKGIVCLFSGDVQGLNPENREKTIRFLVRHIDRYLSTTREYRQGILWACKSQIAKHCVCVCSKRFGNWLVTFYIILKLLFLANSIGQLCLLDAFIGSGYSWYGFEVINSLLVNGSEWTESMRFPRLTLCDIDMRTLGNIQTSTLMCALPINLFNEKIFIFIWFWLVFLSCATIINIIYWVLTFFRPNRRHFIRKFLRVMDRINLKSEGRLCHGFIEDYLRQDGVFVLRLIHKNSNEIIAAELVCALWEHYKKNKRMLHPKQSHVIEESLTAMNL